MTCLPNEIVHDIVRRVGKEGFRELKGFISSSRTLQRMVYSEDVLRDVDVTEFVFNTHLGEPSSPFRPFLERCRNAGNVTAQYVIGLRILVTNGPSEEGISLLLNATPHLLYARFAAAAFLCLCGNKDVGLPVFESFIQMVPNIHEATGIAYRVCDQIQDMAIPGSYLYRGRISFTEDSIPSCGFNHRGGHTLCHQCFGLSATWMIMDLM